jgi:predicted nucleic-acid-binding Zn-ribbon protein
MNQVCPNCGGGKFYSGDVMSGIDRLDDLPVRLQIKPQKFKLPLFDDPIITLPKEGVACKECGSIWSKVDTKKLDVKIVSWLRGGILKNATLETCKNCHGEHALNWSFYQKKKYFFIFTGGNSWYILGKCSEPRISNFCIICRNCGAIQYFVDSILLNKKSKKIEAVAVQKFL